MFGRKSTNILVIKTDSLAGFVNAEPAFEAIRRAHENSKISLLTIPPLQRVARASPYFDQVAAVPDFRNPEARKEFVKQLKTAKFEKVYDLSCDEASKRLFNAMGPFRPKWFTASPPQRKRRQNRQAFDHLPDVGKMLSTAGIEQSSRLPDFHWALSARKDSANMKPSWYGISGNFGLLMPGPDPEKRWTASGYAGLASLMSNEGYMPVLVGSKELHTFGDEIADRAPQLVDLTGKTDHLQLAALANEASFFVTDHAEEILLALSVGCEGVVMTSKEPSAVAPEGRHTVTLTAAQGLDEIDPVFVWRTLSNMGLRDGRENAPQTAAAH